MWHIRRPRSLAPSLPLTICVRRSQAQQDATFISIAIGLTFLTAGALAGFFAVSVAIVTAVAVSAVSAIAQGALGRRAGGDKEAGAVRRDQWHCIRYEPTLPVRRPAALCRLTAALCSALCTHRLRLEREPIGDRMAQVSSV